MLPRHRECGGSQPSTGRPEKGCRHPNLFPPRELATYVAGCKNLRSDRQVGPSTQVIALVGNGAKLFVWRLELEYAMQNGHVMLPSTVFRWHDVACSLCRRRMAYMLFCAGCNSLSYSSLRTRRKCLVRNTRCFSSSGTLSLVVFHVFCFCFCVSALHSSPPNEAICKGKLPVSFLVQPATACVGFMVSCGHMLLPHESVREPTL